MRRFCPGALVCIQLEKVAVLDVEHERRKGLGRKDARRGSKGRSQLGILGCKACFGGERLGIVKKHARDGVHAANKLLGAQLDVVVQHAVGDLAHLTCVACANAVGNRQTVLFVIHQLVTQTLCE